MASNDACLQTSHTDGGNYAGGRAWSQSPEQELASLVLTSFMQDQFYRGAGETLDKARALARVVDPRFVAQLALFVRRELQMRSVSHVLAAEVAELVKGEQWTRRFFRDLAVRADDITAILACRAATYGLHPLPNSLKRGLADALRQQNEYSLAKYRRGSRGITLLDAVNLCRPVETPPLRALMTGTLEAPDTWEVALTRAGQAATTPEEARAAKAATWQRLVAEDKLGYMALLRNLRNIAEHCGPNARRYAAECIADPQRVRRSRQLPFRFATALRELEGPGSTTLDATLSEAVVSAMELAFEHVPALDGATLVAVDSSGSMLGAYRGHGRAPIETATLFAAAIAKKSRADVMLFDTRVQWYTVDRDLPIAALNASITQMVTGGGTDFHLIFEHARARYARIIILSDMQAWVQRVPRPQRIGVQPEVSVPAEDGLGAPDDGPTIDERYDGWDEYLARNGGVPRAGFAPHPRLQRRRVARQARAWGHPWAYLSAPPVDTVGAAYREYRRRTGADPLVYCFDLQGYGTIPFADDRVIQLAGFSEKVFEWMPVFERGGDALVEAVRSVEL